MADQRPESDAQAAPAQRGDSPSPVADQGAAQLPRTAASPSSADAPAPNEVAQAGTADWESGQFVWNAGSLGADDTASSRGAETSELERTVRALKILRLIPDSSAYAAVRRASVCTMADEVPRVVGDLVDVLSAQAQEFAELASRASVSELDQLTQQVAHLQGLNGAATDKFNEMAEYGRGMSVFLEVAARAPVLSAGRCDIDHNSRTCALQRGPLCRPSIHSMSKAVHRPCGADAGA